MLTVFKSSVQTEEILRELRPVLESGWLGLGPKVAEFEGKLSSYLGAPHVVGLNSCTSGLHLLVKTLDLPRGSRVLTTPLTFVATSHVLKYEGLEPVFGDVHPRTGNLTPESVDYAVRVLKVKAVMVVHYAGYPADLDEIRKAARGVPVIQDCAHAMGARYRGLRLGSVSEDDLCAWSFQAVKNLPTGDGGAISCWSKSLKDSLNKLRWFGINKDTITRSSGGYSWEYEVQDLGFKYHLCDILATVGIVQLRHLDADNLRRREIADLYRANLKTVEFPEYDSENQSAYHFFPVFLPTQRQRALEVLGSHQIFPSVHYKLNTEYTMYSDCIQINECRGAREVSSSVLTLPLHLCLTDQDVLRVCDVLNTVQG